MRLPSLLQATLLTAALAGACGSVAIAQLTNDQFVKRLGAVTDELALADARVQALDQPARAKLGSFIMGNLIFTFTHELGHGVVAERHIPVVGRDEDAADQFATLAMLHVGTDLSHQVLIQTARGLWLMAERDKKSGHEPAMYDEHSLDAQRAYQIVCMMVGSDPHAFKKAADLAKMPEDRQESCRFDFEEAAKSWRTLLNETAPTSDNRGSLLERLLGWRHSSTPDHRSEVRIDYGEAADPLAHYRGALMKFGLLELIGGFVERNLSLPRPIALKTMTCHEPNAFWDDRNHQLVFCYELASQYVNLALESLEP
jgi:hypothetical protein